MMAKPPTITVDVVVVERIQPDHITASALMVGGALMSGLSTLWVGVSGLVGSLIGLVLGPVLVHLWQRRSA